MNPEDVPEGPLLVDTSAFSHMLRGGAVGSRLTELTADHDLFVAFVTVGEVMSGATQAGWGQEQLARLELKLAGCHKISGSERVAREYGRLKAHFRGTKGDNDLWIAACSLAEDNPLPIVTTDNDFDDIGTAFNITIVKAG